MDITYILESEEGYTRILATGVFGFYLWGKDPARLVQGIVPLTQHLLWKNKKEAWAPQVVFDPTELLSAGKTTIVYEPVRGAMRAPELTADGEFWNNEEGSIFFVPTSDGHMEEKLLDRIIRECAQTGAR